MTQQPTSIWHDYGFSGNPYSTDPIEPSADGRKLLVGREEQLRKIGRHLAGGASVVALEGDFGVGKTSLAAAAAYEASQWRADGGPLFVSIQGRLSLRIEDTRESFERKVMRAVATTLLEHEAALRADGRSLPGAEGVRRWLQSPEGGGWSAGAGLVASVSGGRTRTPSGSAGFNEVGLAELVDDWLEGLFPDRSAGGVICFLDNLEELHDSTTALKVMEPLRDALFKRPGLRWIVSGAQGMVRAAYSSPKMTGVFLNPIEVPPLPHDEVPQVIAARTMALRQSHDAMEPVSKAAFANLYRSIGQNLRYALNLAERYAYDQEPATIQAMTKEERDAAFDAYVLREANAIYDAYSTGLTKADWKVFEILLRDFSGACSPSEYANFGYSAQPPLLNRIQKLVGAHLVTYTKDEADARRRTVSVTDHGRLAYYRRTTSTDSP